MQEEGFSEEKIYNVMLPVSLMFNFCWHGNTEMSQILEAMVKEVREFLVSQEEEERQVEKREEQIGLIH